LKVSCSTVNQQDCTTAGNGYDVAAVAAAAAAAAAAGSVSSQWSDDTAGKMAC